jgi:hypothetical protein
MSHLTAYSRFILPAILSFLIIKANCQLPVSHPCLILTKESAVKIAALKESLPLLNNSYQKIKKSADKALTSKIEVPVPADEGGGYTHEKHKQNYMDMYVCGISFQLTQDEKYARFIRTMLLKYAELVPGLGTHPANKSGSPGKLFWQSLNDCVWLVNTIQAYDCIYEWLDAKDREEIEKKVLLPMADFLSVGSAKTFDLIHNHGTWAVTAVGMTGLVTGNNDLVEKSLKGLDKDSKGGFYAQIDGLFSPDGYYTEGPYYHRYALMPFLLFAESLEHNKPDLKIFAYKDSVLLKSANALFQLTYTDGRIIPFNDAIKDKTFLADEFVFAADIAYSRTQNRELLSLASKQNSVSIDENGLRVAEAVTKNLKQPFIWRSVEFTDGGDGKQGGVGILRSGEPDDQVCMVMKYSSHGLSHGHYDKLTFNLFDNGQEVIQDYGSARFLNIESKSGGRYLPENKSFALQTIAHNTLVVDGKSDFDGKIDVSSANHSDRYFFDCHDLKNQIVSARENNAYPGIEIQRTMAMVSIPKYEKPIIIDVLRTSSAAVHQYDLPFYYRGQFITTNLEMNNNVRLRKPLGSKNGYQHLWLDATGISKDPTAKFTWILNNRFYTISSLTDDSTSFLFAQIGANDADFNLRNDPCFIIRQKGSANHTFISVIEPHGDYNGKDEITTGSESRINEIKKIVSDSEITITEIQLSGRQVLTLCIANGNAEKDANHSYTFQGKKYNWKGPYQIELDSK